MMGNEIVFLDLEIGKEDQKIHDIGILRGKDESLHTTDIRKTAAFLKGSTYLCGHNLVHHDLKYLSEQMDCSSLTPIDTLYLSPLLFPKRPYHNLVKDDKLFTDQWNNPVNDCKKAQSLFFDELNAFGILPRGIRQIFCRLLYDRVEFRGFFQYLHYRPILTDDYPALIRKEFKGKICENTKLDQLMEKYPCELAYALALIRVADASSITPPWLIHQFPVIERILHYLCATPCKEGCDYCREKLDVHKGLKRFFGFDEFRLFDGVPLQEQAARAAVEGRSLLAVFPTGGGKSVTFQLPALMAHESVHGLTVVISPLQSLMKDQVDHLVEEGTTSAVTINGLLDPVERKEVLDRVEDGRASLLYISPESLRSKTVERILLKRNVVRFVIDEAHCFSAWGQDFRVDYLYIGDFIKQYQDKKLNGQPVAVSCFTATAKQKVISDIRDYFRRKLGLELELFASKASRTNLHYSVLFEEDEDKKYDALRSLILSRRCPTIVYVSTVRKTQKLAERLTADGMRAEPYNGRMDPDVKIRVQDSFLQNEVPIIVATSAFGMGVDKKDIRLVVHYEISSSLEDYVQEAGRAGRDPSLEAECFVLFNERDLDSHFLMLNQTKLSMVEIQQIWRAIKNNSVEGTHLRLSPLELARLAGWDEAMMDPETRVRTAIAALENAGYVRRGNNMPRVYATSINVESMAEASRIMQASPLFTDKQRETASRILSFLFSSRSVKRAQNEEAESRVDYLADRLGLSREEVVESVTQLRAAGLLADSQDMTAYIYHGDRDIASTRTLNGFARLERALLGLLQEGHLNLSLKEVNQLMQDQGIAFSNIKRLRTLLYFLTIKKYVAKTELRENKTTEITVSMPYETLTARSEKRLAVCTFCLEELYRLAEEQHDDPSDLRPVVFSLLGLLTECRRRIGKEDTSVEEIEEALLYLSKTGSIKIEGGFLVLYNALDIERVVLDNHIQFKKDDYRTLDAFYQQKIQQIHIVGEFANLMVRDYSKAMQYIGDYFQMDYDQFMSKYFAGRKKEVTRNITSKKHQELFGDLSESQLRIIQDSTSRVIVVAAGPGSGKTRVLVHKLASLLLMEDIKQDQLLMLTFSRSAATEFKQRLYQLIGAPAKYVDIKTFHSYCFDLLGTVGRLEEADSVENKALELIRSGEIEPEKITKSVLVIDESQDMSETDFALIQELIAANDDLRVIAVGDDDQNIFAFRGSDSRYMRRLITEYGATVYELVENYRSSPPVVELANRYGETIRGRLKKTPVTAVRKGTGKTTLIRHNGKNPETALVNLLAQTYHGERACVLTQTNEEALQILCLLRQRGIRARLIQSLGDFRLENLAEIRYFLKLVDSDEKSPVIPDTVWTEAVAQLKTVYENSACLPNCLKLIEDFDSTAPIRYRTDLLEFIRESSYEDFYPDEQKNVIISTIHRAKGREFDSVHLLLLQRPGYRNDDEERRKIYVALTRAKDDLFIHCNYDLCSTDGLENLTSAVSNRDYPEAREVVLQFGHADVVLDFLRNKKEIILRLRSGDPLFLSDGYLTAELGGRTVTVAKLSKRGMEQVGRYFDKGYSFQSSTVRFVVAWKKKEETDETAVPLVDITLAKEEAEPRPRDQ